MGSPTCGLPGPPPVTASAGVNLARPSPAACACCEVRHAHRLVCSDGLDLGRIAAAAPIGMGYRVCGRFECPQRMAPPLGHPVRIAPNVGALVPCPVVQTAVEKLHRS